MIEFLSVTKYFGHQAAVKGFSFDVPSHQAVALWGENGAGKTTLIKCLLGLLRYDGRILINGLDATRAGRQARRITGYVPQEMSFYDGMTTWETACFFAQLKRTPLSRARHVLAQVGLNGHENKAVAALSGGMKQRLALGLALLADPPVLVLDEPTSNLDAGGRSQLLQLLREVKAAGKTILFTSHRLDEIEQLADQAVVMEKGELTLACSGAELAARLGLCTTVKLRLASELLDAALRVLQGDGFQASRNGTGVLVQVRPGEKAQPIHSLSRAHIAVTDFEIE